MRLSEFGEKELINITDGSRYSDLYDLELIFDEKKGKIRAILIPEYKSRFRFRDVDEHIQILWESIRKIGDDIIIVETEV